MNLPVASVTLGEGGSLPLRHSQITAVHRTAMSAIYRTRLGEAIAVNRRYVPE